MAERAVSDPTPAEMEKAHAIQQAFTALCPWCNHGRECQHCNDLASLLHSHAEEAVKANADESAKAMRALSDNWREAVSIRQDEIDALKAATEDLRRQFSLQEIDHQNELAEERQAREKAEKDADEFRADAEEARDIVKALFPCESGEGLRSLVLDVINERDDLRERLTVVRELAKNRHRRLMKRRAERDAALAEVERLKKSQSWLEQYQYALRAYNHVCDENAALVKRVAELERDAVALFEYGAMTRADLRAGLREISAIGQEQACYADNAVLRKRVEELEGEGARLASLHHGIGQEHAIEDANAGRIDDLIATRLEQARREGAEAMRQRAAQWHKDEAAHIRQTQSGYASREAAQEHDEYAEEILALPIDPPKAQERDLVGKVGICSQGRPGLITGRKELPWGLSWVGDGLDGKGPWASRSPKVVAESLDEWQAKAERPMTWCTVEIGINGIDVDVCGHKMPCPTHYPKEADEIEIKKVNRMDTTK